jgi:ribosomal protein S18 acetylase RimI-like enzyme
MSFQMNPKIELRPAGEADKPFLFELFRAIRAAWFDFQPGGHPQITMVVRLQFQAREHALAAQYPGADDSLVLLDGAPVGRLRVVRGGAGFQLADIALLPGHQRKGIGTAVMKGLFAEAQQAELPVRSMIARTDLPLFHFYRSLGFEVTSEEAGHLRLQWRAT